MNPNQPLIDKGKPFVLAIAGGGSEAACLLLRHGGMSNVCLLVVILQAKEATDEFLGRAPDRYVSADTSRQMAMVSYEMARGVRPDDDIIGIGATSTLVKPDGEREGRKHTLFVTAQKRDSTHTFEVTLWGKRARIEEEAVAAAFIRQVVLLSSNVFTDVRCVLGDDDTVSPVLTLGQTQWVDLMHGKISIAGERHSKFIMPSSCNPLHDGHLGMMEYVCRELGAKVDVELCITNADKPPLDYYSIHQRVYQTEDRLRNNPAFGSLFLTNLGTFAQKAQGCPESVFLVGADTIARVNDKRFHDDSEGLWQRAMNTIDSAGCQFLVFPRTGTPLTEDDLKPELRKLCTFVTEGYVSSNLSSTEIRKSQRDV